MILVLLQWGKDALSSKGKKITVDQKKVLKNWLFCFFLATRYRIVLLTVEYCIMYNMHFLQTPAQGGPLQDIVGTRVKGLKPRKVSNSM